MADPIRSAALGVPHGFLTAPQSMAGEFGLVDHSAGPVFARQVHSALALAVERPFPGERPEVDALVTATPGLAIGIVTADCAPVLLADAQARVVGAAHAGWRGAFGGVLEAVVEEMALLGARRENIVAAIGPTIATASYEIDEAFRDRFLQADPHNEAFFRRGAPGHFQFDLPAYVAARLAASGIGAVEDLALDTYADPERFFSYRRATHRGESTDGRLVSLIALPA